MKPSQESLPALPALLPQRQAAEGSAGRYIDIDIVSRYFANIDYRIEVFEYRDMYFDIFVGFKA